MGSQSEKSTPTSPICDITKLPLSLEGALTETVPQVCEDKPEKDSDGISNEEDKYESPGTPTYPDSGWRAWGVVLG